MPEIGDQPNPLDRAEKIKQFFTALPQKLFHGFDSKTATLPNSSVTQLEPAETDQSQQVNYSKNTIQSYKDSLRSQNLEVPSIEASGIPALFGGNERVNIKTFLEAFAADTPDGYLAGVGFGSVFGCLEAFAKNSPKAIVLADMDPRVVLAGKTVIELIKNSTTTQEFLNALGDTEKINMIIQTVRADDDDLCKESILTDDQVGKTLDTLAGKYEHEREFASNSTIRLEDIYGVDAMETDLYHFVRASDEIIRFYPILRKLALQGNFDITLADFTDPNFIWAVRNGLPGFKTSDSVVYSSNISDYIINRPGDINVKKPVEERIEKANRLRRYFSFTGDTGYLVDTLQSDNYRFRTHKASEFKGYRVGPDDDEFDNTFFTRMSNLNIPNPLEQVYWEK
jgi:hypothetical protein